jgi:predicted O-methyltransferase YrrM
LSYHLGCVRFDEIVFLASIVKHVQPEKLFEIGTCIGRTTINLVKNCDKLKALYTLNLPPDDSCQVDWVAQDRKLYEYSKDKIGARWKKYSYGSMITQLYGDSSKFDYTPYKDMDFVFIDANKQKNYVASDSANGWKMLRSGGILMWHDYAYCDGVTEAVDEFGDKMHELYARKVQ